MQTEDFHDSVRPGLIAMLPRLKRFAGLMVGERQAGTVLLRRALTRMLAEQHRYQRGTALDRWAFAEIYRQWLYELGAHDDPVGQAKTDDASFEQLFYEEDGAPFDAVTARFLGSMPPQQRLTLLLAYGEGFDHADTGRVLDIAPETVASRLVRASVTLAERLGRGTQAQPSATIATLYPEAPRGSP